MIHASNRIKIVHVIADSSLTGGPKHVLGLLKNINTEKFQVFLICPPGYLANHTKEIKGIEVTAIPMRSKFDWVAILRLKRKLEQIQAQGFPFTPMIVHSHGPRAGLFCLFASPRAVFKVYTEHLYDATYKLPSFISDKIQRWFLKQILSAAHTVIAVSDEVKRFLISQRYARESKVFTVPNGIELEKFDPTSPRLRGTGKIKENNRHPVIGTIGSLNWKKGHEYLIQAMPIILQKFPLATLEIIGEGRDREKLEFLIARLRLERHVALLGKKENAADFMHHWSVFAFPSLSETFGIVLLEAFAAGIPVVATKIGGIKDIITNNKNGILVPSCDSERLAKEIINVLDNPVLAAKLKRGGLERVKAFEWKTVIKSIEKIYDELTGEKNG
ncbi:MAG TPA: glycosyltransferase family 4 protein [bacterium]|nr:glycosyltransferase family 4 protein [bacterium]